jgi:hypothetical protein
MTQVGAEGRVRRLVLHQLALAGERQAPEVVPAAQIARLGQAGAPPAGGEKGVGGHRDVGQRLQARPLMAPEGFWIERLERGHG